MWESPIKQILGEMHTEMEGECMKVVQQYGFDVDKEELTKALMYDRQQYEKGYAEGYEAAKQWIPCSERLPETNESVLCWAKSTARGGDVCFVGSCHNGFWFFQSSADTHSFPGQYVIVAWQPLPEAYKEGGAV